MPRGNGQRLPGVMRRQAIQTLQGLLAAGVSDSEARQQIAQRYNVSTRTTRDWLTEAYDDLAKEVDTDRRQLVGVALQRRRLVMSRSAQVGDWKTYMQAAESESRLLGLDAPKQTEHHVILEKVTDMTRVVAEVVRDHFIDDPVGRARFIRALRERMGSALQRKSTITLPALSEEPGEEAVQ